MLKNFHSSLRGSLRTGCTHDRLRFQSTTIRFLFFVVILTTGFGSGTAEKWLDRNCLHGQTTTEAPSSSAFVCPYKRFQPFLSRTLTKMAEPGEYEKLTRSYQLQYKFRISFQLGKIVTISYRYFSNRSQLQSEQNTFYVAYFSEKILRILPPSIIRPYNISPPIAALLYRLRCISS